MENIISSIDLTKEGSSDGETPSNSFHIESWNNSNIERSTLLQLRSPYRKLQRMHPYAVTVKMMVKEIFMKIVAEKNEKRKQNDELKLENVTLRNTVKSCGEQITWQENRIKLLEEQIKVKDERITSLEDQIEKMKEEEVKKLEESNKTIELLEERIKIQNEGILTQNKNQINELVENDCTIVLDSTSNEIINSQDKTNELAEDSAIVSCSTSKEIIDSLGKTENSVGEKAIALNSTSERTTKSQDDKIQSLEAELLDMNYRVKKQEMQIQFLEIDLKYKDEAQSTYSENAQRQEIRIQFLEIELNYRKNVEDTLKQDIEKLKTNVDELTTSANSLKCENLSLNSILNEMKSSMNKDGCSSNDSFCCETVKQIKLSFIDLIETEFECVICNGMFIEATVTSCNHMFCSFCLQTWRKKSFNCPICRSLIKYDIKTTVIDNYILNTAKLLSEKMFNDRKKMLEERKQAKYTSTNKFKRIRLF